MEVTYFKVKHTVFKKSLHGELWSDFRTISEQSQVKLEFFQNEC
jgi:hypothetical protein